jgi:hypothetical protein
MKKFPGMKKTLLVMTVGLSLFPFGRSFAGDLPACLGAEKSRTVRSVVEGSGAGEEEILTRLVYAEGLSTGHADDPSVYEAIAWGVMNRVRLGDAFPSRRKVYGRGIAGVIFKEGQFNPAVSRRSQFSKEFLCPSHPARWRLAGQAARKAIAGTGNPFIETQWEREHGLSLVTGFYYPDSIQAKSPLAPWEKSRALEFIGDVKVGGTILSAQKVRFYRLAAPPGSR